ncbi:hypothetical protein GCM10010378_63170 [Streptomyces viridochromogenes]
MEVTVTIALTSLPPSGRYSFWYTSTENRGTLGFEKLAISIQIPLDDPALGSWLPTDRSPPVR